METRKNRDTVEAHPDLTAMRNKYRIMDKNVKVYPVDFTYEETTLYIYDGTK